jgi:tripartite-type tricarboxylate transporter receptor subunit TctC
VKFSRRNFLQITALAGALPVVSRVALAQDYPVRPVQIVAGFPPGAASDITARLIGQWLSQQLGQPFVTENRPGAGGNVGTEAVVRAPADGYTLLLITPSNAINATLYENLNFNFIRDIAPVASIIRSPFVMVVHPSFSARTVADIITYAKANPGKLAFGSTGIGSGVHLAGELFKLMTGIEWLHVPYRGPAQALTDLLGGQIQVVFAPVISATSYVHSGQLRALAVTTATRLDVWSDIPTVGESVPDYEASGWLGVGAPKKTPAEVIAKLNTEINAGLGDPSTKSQLANLGGTPLAGSPDDFGKLIGEETEKWSKVIRAAGIKPE